MNDPDQLPGHGLGSEDSPVEDLRSSRSWPVNGLIACGAVLLATVVSAFVHVPILLGLAGLLLPFALVGLPIFGVLALTRTKSRGAAVAAGAGIGILGTILFAVLAVMGMMFLLWFIGLAGSGLR